MDSKYEKKRGEAIQQTDEVFDRSPRIVGDNDRILN